MSSLSRSRRWWVCLALLLATASLAAQGSRTETPGKRALLIGVSQYARGGDPASEWWDLSSGTDVQVMRELLVERFGFQDASIQLLRRREETTRQQILAAFDRLIADTRAGDIVYIHYSGHGAPVPDANGDEFDGLDESLVPSDYVARADGSRNITDDTIGALLAGLSAKRPGSVLLVFDSCYSGTQTRGGRMVVRGGNFLPTGPRTGVTNGDVSGIADRKAFAEGYVVISATRDNQIAMETDDDAGSMGLLTYALAQQLRTVTATTTYRDLFDGVQDAMVRRASVQRPQIEGDLDTLLLNGTAVAQQPYLETRVQDGALVLAAGAIHGITAGSRVNLYPRGTKTFGNAPAAVAEVMTVRPTTSVLRLPGSLTARELEGARAVETSHRFADASVRVDTTDLGRTTLSAAVAEEIARLEQAGGLVRTTRGERWDLKVCGTPCREAQPGPAQTRGVPAAGLLVRSDGSVAAEIPSGPDGARALRASVEREARWRVIASLDHADTRVDVDVRPVHVDVTTDASGRPVSVRRRPQLRRTREGQAAFAVTDFFMLELRNRGSRDAFVTVLDLSPDGTINPLWPHPRVGRGVQENRIPAAPPDREPAWIPVPLPYVFQVGPPFGTEIVKAIATDVPTDFSSVLAGAQSDSRGTAAAPPPSPLALLLAAAGGLARGRQVAGEVNDTTAWSARSFTYVIQAP